jgi:hypothetical protein
MLCDQCGFPIQLITPGNIEQLNNELTPIGCSNGAYPHGQFELGCIAMRRLYMDSATEALALIQRTFAQLRELIEAGHQIEHPFTHGAMLALPGKVLGSSIYRDNLKTGAGQNDGRTEAIQ